MKFKLVYQVALSLLIARWKQTLVAAIGVTISITMFITVLSFMSGLNDMLDGLITNRTAHIRIYKEIKISETQPADYVNSKGHNFVSSIKPKNELLGINNSKTIIAYLQKDKRVLGVAPKINAQVFYNVGAVDLTGAIFGIDPVEENRLFHFSDYVTAGNYIDLKNIPNIIILGKGVATKMMANIGDVIQVTTSKGEIVALRVVGIFQSGIQEFDNVQSYCSLTTTQKLVGKPSNYITDIQVKLKDILWAPEVAKEYRKVYELNAVDIQAANSQFETGSSVRTLISYAVGITLLLVAGFGIYNILNMMIYEKMDSIAILKAVGFSGNDVNKIFISIALSIGIFGGLMGLLFGFGLSALIDQIPFNTESLPTITTYPINYNPRFYFIGGTFALITTYFAGFFPSRKASGIDPVIIIRGK